jgi:glycosyltransferase involved in cell wall biosynthesis
MSLEAAVLLRKRGHSFILVFTGQGQDKEKLEKLTVERGLDKVVFTGHITDRNLLDGLYMAASLFVFPSLYDTAGLVVREAAVMGTPSVVVKNSAPAEVITDGLNGLVCNNTAENLCDAMESYLFVMSDDERAAIRKHARESIPLPWETVMTEVEERYKAIIAKGTRKRKSVHRHRSI